jgi:ATP-dependent RNA/DNA helicase IGHMBP2
MSSLSELERLRELLAQEKEEDFEQFRSLVRRLSLEDRKSQGFTWHPVVPVKTGFTIGDRCYVIVERPADNKEPHRFRSGAMASMYSLAPEGRGREVSGVINFVDRNRMKVILGSRDIPDWLSRDQLAVDLLFDERTYLEMDKALEQVMKARGDRLAELRDIVLGKFPPAFFPDQVLTKDLPGLNDSQLEAVHGILASRHFALVHGPPGTGKTTTLVAAIVELTKGEATVLVTAPSNAATDLLTLRLAAAGLQTVRVGNIGRVDEETIRYTLEAQVASHPESKHVRKVRIQAAEQRRKAQKYRHRRDREGREKRAMYGREARELSSWANQLEDRLVDQVLSGAQVICCTLVGAAHPVLKSRTFRTVVIDEAAQALEPACWIAIAKASRVVMAGDPFQLPPTVKSVSAARGGLSVTLLEKCLQRFSDQHLLEVQYRMHRQIMQFSNDRFYAGSLQADSSVADARLSLSMPYSPVNFVDTAGCGFEEEVEPRYQSRFNPGEVNIMREHIYQLLDAFEDQPVASIGIISPYREQIRFMKEHLATDPRLASLPITIDTIDAFQGQEREIIYISLVRSNQKQEIGFLKDYRRMNVAMTRARRKLVIVGDSATIGEDPFYRSFLEYCEHTGHYRSAWEYMA